MITDATAINKIESGQCVVFTVYRLSSIVDRLLSVYCLLSIV